MNTGSEVSAMPLSKSTIRHCIEKTGSVSSTEYEIQENPNNENIILLHASKGFLTKHFTEELRNRLIFVSATASLHDEHPMSYFLHYLEPEEDTFMDSLANQVSTDNTVPEEEIDDYCYVCGTEVEHWDTGSFICPECEIYYGLLKDGSFEVSDIGNRLSQNQLEKLSEATGESWFL